MMIGGGRLWLLTCRISQDETGGTCGRGQTVRGTVYGIAVEIGLRDSISKIVQSGGPFGFGPDQPSLHVNDKFVLGVDQGSPPRSLASKSRDEWQPILSLPFRYRSHCRQWRSFRCRRLYLYFGSAHVQAVPDQVFGGSCSCRLLHHFACRNAIHDGY
jgi:hypothetical protein